MSREDIEKLRAIAERCREAHMHPGTVHSHGALGGSAGGGGSEALRSWTSRGDWLMNICEGDPREPEACILTQETDAIVTRLKAGGPGVPGNLSERLAVVTLREDIMVATYPGRVRGRYLKHLDKDRCAVLTTILYLNEGWRREDGGALRLYHRTGREVKAEILPEMNRLLLFWSDEDNPHEVLSTLRDRYAMTTWYTDGAASCRKYGLGKLAPSRGERLNPVAPLSLEEALRLSGVRDGCDVERLARLRAAQVPSGLARPGTTRCCAGCGGSSEEGAEGSGDFAGEWFCSRCWYLWRPPPGSGGP